jgi:hypothetical protein
VTDTTGKRVRSEGTITFVLRVTSFVVLALCQPAWAETKVGVVVGGADPIHTQTESTVTAWLTQHTLTVTSKPLGKDGQNTLINCLVISDMGCARGVVEARADSDVIGIVEQMTGKRNKRSVQLSAYWIAKHHEVVSLQRTCDACTDAVLAKTIEAMLMDLARLAPTMTGKVHVISKPLGLAATIDGKPIGVTPADHDVPFGQHTISVSRDGHVVGERQVDVAPDVKLEVDVPVREEKTTTIIRPVVVEHRSRVVPIVMIGIGVAGVVTGAWLYSNGDPTGQSYYYRDTKPAGIATMAGGGALAIIGTILVFRHSSSTPDIAIKSDGAVVGWAGRF